MKARVAALAAGASVAVSVAASIASPAGAQTPQVRLAAARDCPANINCIPGFKRVYGIDPTGVYTALAVADSGVQALDDGAAEVAVAFSSNPQLSRPDILTLADDKRMITPDHVVPIVRERLVKRYGRALRQRLDDTSALLTTFVLRGLNQQVIDGRMPQAVGGEFSDSNGLGVPAGRPRKGPLIRIGYNPFNENETLADLYGEALRGAGFRVSVSQSGLRPATVRAFRRDRIDMWIGYSGSLLGYLGGKRLSDAAARLGARAMKLSPAQDRNGFAMKRDVAHTLGIAKLSDLARYWPAASTSGSTKAAQVPPDGGSVGAAGTDPLLGEQWAVAPGSVLDLPGAWQLTRGAGVTVAIVDSGARLDHPDLAPNIWTNFDETPGNGVDDDHNGYVDDVHGVDLTSKHAGQNLNDGFGHGTHVAGIVAAARNGRGVVGVAPQAKLMIVRVLDDHGGGTTGAVAEGIRYAAANGARVINLSLESDFNDARVTDAVAAAAAANVLVVASAGNSGRDIDRQPAYPAAIPSQVLLAVASTDPDSGRGISNYSNFGRLAVQVAAPGAEIISTANDGGYVEKSGTSMAAPMVAGVAALAASVNPTISAVDLRSVLMQNATVSRLQVASGYVDALRSVLAASHASGYANTQPPRVQVLSATRKASRTKVQAAVLGSTAAIRSYQLRLANRPVAQLMAGQPIFTFSVRRPGKRATVSALDANGNAITTAQQKVKGLRKGKGGVGTGGRVGS